MTDSDPHQDASDKIQCDPASGQHPADRYIGGRLELNPERDPASLHTPEGRQYRLIPKDSEAHPFMERPWRTTPRCFDEVNPTGELLPGQSASNVDPDTEDTIELPAVSFSSEPSTPSSGDESDLARNQNGSTATP